jgi:hypothetical protein
MYQYRGYPLLLVQVSTENDTIRIFYVFTLLITILMHSVQLSFSYLTQIWKIQKH